MRTSYHTTQVPNMPCVPRTLWYFFFPAARFLLRSTRLACSSLMYFSDSSANRRHSFSLKCISSIFLSNGRGVTATKKEGVGWGRHHNTCRRWL